MVCSRLRLQLVKWLLLDPNSLSKAGGMSWSSGLKAGGRTGGLYERVE